MSDLLFNPREARQRAFDVATAQPHASLMDQIAGAGQRIPDAFGAASARLAEGVFGPALSGIANVGPVVEYKLTGDVSDTSFWDDLQERAQTGMANARTERRRLDAADPVRRTWASDMVYGLTQMFALGAVGGVVGGGAAGLAGITGGTGLAIAGGAGSAAVLGPTYGVPSYYDFMAEGVDEATARGAAFREGASMAVLGALPIAIPGRILQRAASGVALNVPFGMLSRRTMESYLRDNGYEEQAQRYRWNDGQMIATDAIMGAVFGGLLGHRSSAMEAPIGGGDQGGGVGPDAPASGPREPEWYFNEAQELANHGDLGEAYAHALIARELGNPEAQGLLDMLAEEGGSDIVTEGQAGASVLAIRDQLVELDQDAIDAAMTVQDDYHARVSTAPGIPLDARGEDVHAENLRAYDEAAANGEEFPPARWDDGDAESFAPHPDDNYVATEAEDAIRNVLEQEGFSDLARDIESRRERIRSMGGAIDPGDMYFSRRGESAERRSEAFQDDRLSPQQNKAVEMALNNYSNAEIADELDVSLAQVFVVLTNARRRAPNVEIEHARLGTTPGTHGGRRTATIEEIVALHNRLARQGYSNKLGNPVAGRRNLNTVIGERLGLSPKNIAKRLSEYRAGLRDGRIKGEALYSVARPGAGGRPNVNLNFIRRMLSEGETDLVKVTEALNEHRRELGMPPTTEQAVRSQAALDRRLNRTELNVATNEMQTTRRTGVEPSESAFKNMSRVLGAVESIARENGGAPPPGWQDAVAAETGYSPRSVSVLWDRIKAGEFGDELAARANTIPNAGRSRSAQRVLIGRLMDQGLSRQAITERVNVVRDSENKPPMTPQNVSAVMTQIRDARLNGDMRYSMTEDGTFSTPEDLKAAAIEAFGSDWNVLARAGNVEVVQTSADVPAGMFGLPRGVQAVHMRDTRTTYFIANNVRPEDMKGLILHEVGVHHGFEAMVGKRGFKEVLRQIERMIDADHPALVQARAFAERYSARDEHIPEETLAYLIETQADMPLVNSVLSKLRQWLVKTFGSTFGMQLTVDDLRALAITSLRRVAEQARREAGPAVEVLPIQDAVILASNGPDARPAQGGRRSPYQEELRAQGFDVESPLYRGMTRQAEGGDFTRNADLQGSEQFHGTSFSRSTSEANLYAMEGDGGAVYPAYMRGRLESGPDYMRAVQARARESGVTNQEAARQVQQEYAQRGVTGVEWPPDRYGKGGEVRIFDQSNTASPFGANAPRTAPDGGPVQAGRGAERITMYGPDETGAYTVEATVDGKLVGRTDLFPHEGGFAPEGGQVIPAFQRQGVMSRILQHAEQEIGASLRRPMGMTDEGRAMWEQYASRRTAPNAGDARDFPKFSMGEPRQNADNLVGGRNARRDPIEAPEYQARVGRLQEALSGDDASGTGRASRGERSDAPVKDGDKPDKGLARQARDVLALSGVHIARIENPMLGSLRATVDSPIDLPARLRDALQEYPDARSYNAGIDFDVVEGGKNVADPKAPEGRRDGLYIRWTSVPDALQGAGIGSWLYRQVIDWAHRRGLSVFSDTSLTEKSWPMYERLKDYGYDVEQINPTTRDPITKTRESINDEPIWEIRQSYNEKPYDAAKPPYEDYQIDGPTLRERQKVLDDQRARQEEYDKASPLEQVLKDDPNMMLSMGTGRSVKASEAIEMSVEAQQEAVAKKKAFEAAVRCAIRHGGSMAGRSFVTLGGRGASQAASASQLLGQTLGLAAAGPAAWGVSHAARRNADPLGYAVDRTNMAAEAVRQEEARFAREGHQAGVNAGLDAPTGYDVPEGEPLWDNVDTSRRSGNAPPDSIEPPMQSSSNSNDPLRSGVAQGRDPGAWDQTTPTRYMAPGGGTTPNGARVPPAPPGLDDDK